MTGNTPSQASLTASASLLAIGLAAVLAAGTALAASLVPGAKLGSNAQEIVASLTERGYEVVKYEREDDEIEVYVLKDGRRFELEIDPQSGQLRKVEDED